MSGILPDNFLWPRGWESSPAVEIAGEIASPRFAPARKIGTLPKSGGRPAKGASYIGGIDDQRGRYGMDAHCNRARLIYDLAGIGTFLRGPGPGQEHPFRAH